MAHEKAFKTLTCCSDVIIVHFAAEDCHFADLEVMPFVSQSAWWLQDELKFKGSCS